MTKEHLYWSVLAHSKLTLEQKMQLLRTAGADLTTFIEAGLSGLDDGLRRRFAELVDAASSEAFTLETMGQQGMDVITGKDLRYPRRLKEALRTRTPLVLYAAGNADLLNGERTVAIVGARDASPEAIDLTHRAARYFAREGYAVVSGCAKGVDQAAFDGAIDGGGATIAVLPQGLLNRSTSSLLRKHTGLLNEGRVLFVSELHPNTPWQSRFAMMRNRLVVGLADMLIVAQTGLKESIVKGKKQQSGTWNAAQQGRKLGRPVFVFDLAAEGNEALAQAFAIPIQPTEDEAMFYRIEDITASKSDLEDAVAVSPAQMSLFKP